MCTSGAAPFDGAVAANQATVCLPNPKATFFGVRVAGLFSDISLELDGKSYSLSSCNFRTEMAQWVRARALRFESPPKNATRLLNNIRDVH